MILVDLFPGSVILIYKVLNFPEHKLDRVKDKMDKIHHKIPINEFGKIEVAYIADFANDDELNNFIQLNIRKRHLSTIQTK